MVKCKIVFVVFVVFMVFLIGLFVKFGLYYGVDFIGGIMIELIVLIFIIDELRNVIESNGFD